MGVDAGFTQPCTPAARRGRGELLSTAFSPPSARTQALSPALRAPPRRAPRCSGLLLAGRSERTLETSRTESLRDVLPPQHGTSTARSEKPSSPAVAIASPPGPGRPGRGGSTPHRSARPRRRTTSSQVSTVTSSAWVSRSRRRLAAASCEGTKVGSAGTKRRRTSDLICFYQGAYDPERKPSLKRNFIWRRSTRRLQGRGYRGALRETPFNHMSTPGT